MKLIRHTIILLLLLGTFLGLIQPSFGDAGDISCRPEWAMPNGRLRCQRIQDTVEGKIEGKESKTFTFELEGGTYSFGAWVSLDIVSVEISVTDSEGNELAREGGEYNIAACEIQLQEAKKVKVIVTAGEARIHGVSGSYAFVAARGQGCFEIEPYVIEQLLDDWTAMVSHDNWSVVNWRVQEISGTDTISIPIHLAPGLYRAIAETTNVLDDIDLYVKCGPHAQLCSKEEPDNNPVCEFELTSEADLTIQISPWKYGKGESTKMILMIVKSVG